MSEEQKPIDVKGTSKEFHAGFEFDWSGIDEKTRVEHEQVLLGIGKYKNVSVDMESGQFLGALSKTKDTPEDRTLLANMILVDGWPKDERLMVVTTIKSRGATESSVRLLKVRLEPKVRQGSYLSDSEITDKSRILLDLKSKVSVDIDNKNMKEIAVDSDEYLSLPDEAKQMILDVKPKYIKLRETGEINQTRVVQPIEDRSNEHGSPTMSININDLNFD